MAIPLLDRAPTTEPADEWRFLHRPIVFLEPDRIVDPASWLDYTPFAFWIVDALRPSLFVELEMVRTIRLDDDARLRAVEVDDVSTQGLLAAKLHAEPVATQASPHQPLGRCRIPP